MSPTSRATARMPLGQLTVLAAALFAAVTTELIPIGLLPQLSAAFGVAPSRIGWWTSVYALVVAAGAIPLTAALTRLPRRGVLLALLGCYLLSNLVVVAAGAMTTSYPLALSARVLGGLAHAGFFSMVIATAVEISPPQRAGRAVSVVSSGVMAAFAFGVPLATAVGDRLGWRVPFLGMAGLLLVLVFAAGLLLPAQDHVGRKGSALVGGGAPVGCAPSAPQGAARLRARAPLVVVGAFSVLFLLGHTTGYTYVTSLLQRSGVGEEGAGPLLFAFGCGSLVGVAVITRVADAHPTSALRLSGAVMAACLVAFALPPAGAGIAACVLVVWGAAYGGLPAMLQTAGLRVTADPTSAPAVVNATTNAGIAAGAWLGGQVLPLGASAVAGTAAVVVLLALALTWVPAANRLEATTAHRNTCRQIWSEKKVLSTSAADVVRARAPGRRSCPPRVVITCSGHTHPLGGTDCVLSGTQRTYDQHPRHGRVRLRCVSRRSINPTFWALAQLGSRVLSRPPAGIEDPPLHLPDPQPFVVPTRHGPVPVLVQRPAAPASFPATRPAPPVLVHLHGGGFVNRNPAQDLHIARHLAAHVGAVVLLPDYSTAPRVRYPVAEEQVFDLYRWVVDHGAVHGWDGEGTAISGVSAGAKLAINTCQLLRDAGLPRPDALALVVPVTDVVRTDRTSAVPRPAISPFVQSFVGWAYFPDVARRAEPLASPRLDPDLPAALPPTLVLTAEHDTLAKEGAELAAGLRAGGVTVQEHCYPASDHGFIAQRPVEVVRDALDRMSGFFRRHLRGSL